MKRFYSIEPKGDFGRSSREKEDVEYDINTLIRFEAECIADCKLEIPDDEIKDFIEKKCVEIKTLLMRDGIWYNDSHQPVFLYK